MRRTHTAEDELQLQLRDLLALAVAGDHLRWVVTEDPGGKLAGWLAEATSAWRVWADGVAQELAASGVAPDGRVRALAKDIALNWVPEGWIEAEAARLLLVERLVSLGDHARYRCSQSEGRRGELLDVVRAGIARQLLELRVGSGRV
jgi:hypothetical protein